MHDWSNRGRSGGRRRNLLPGTQRFADNRGMSRISLVLVFVIAAFVAVPVAGGPQCDPSGGGDICASGSVWYDFTQLRIQPRDRSGPATTMTIHPQQDFSIEIDGAKEQRGKIIVIGGRAMLMHDVPHEKGYEIDALDARVLMNQLIVTLLDQAFPAGPSSVRTRHRVQIEQKSRAIRIATPSASSIAEGRRNWQRSSSWMTFYSTAGTSRTGPYTKRGSRRGAFSDSVPRIAREQR